MDLSRLPALLAALDRHVDRLGVLQRARRKMKGALMALGAGASLVVVEALGLSVLLQSGPRPPLIEYWGPLSAIGVALIAFATLRAAHLAHKEYTSAALASKASRDELLGLAKLIEDLHDDLRELRQLVESRLSA